MYVAQWDYIPIFKHKRKKRYPEALELMYSMEVREIYFKNQHQQKKFTRSQSFSQPKYPQNCCCREIGVLSTLV